MSRVQLVEANDLLRNSLDGYLTERGVFEVVASTGSATAAIELAQECQPACVLVGVHLSDGFGLWVAEELKAAVPMCKVIVLSPVKEPLLLTKFLELGVSACVKNPARFKEVEETIQNVLSGLTYLPQVDRDIYPPNEMQLYDLPARDISLLYYTYHNKSLAELAEIFSMSQQEICQHLARIFQVVGVQSTTELRCLRNMHDDSGITIKQELDEKISEACRAK